MHKNPNLKRSVEKARFYVSCYKHDDTNETVGLLVEKLGTLDDKRIRGIVRTLVETSIHEIMSELYENKRVRKNLVFLEQKLKPRRGRPRKPREPREFKCSECTGKIEKIPATSSHKGGYICRNCGLVHEFEDLLEKSEINRAISRFRSKISKKSKNLLKSLPKAPGEHFRNPLEKINKLEKIIEDLKLKLVDIEDTEKKKIRAKIAKVRDALKNEKKGDLSKILNLLRAGILDASPGAWNLIPEKELLSLLEVMYRCNNIDSIFKGDYRTGSLFTRSDRMAIRSKYLKPRVASAWIYQEPAERSMTNQEIINSWFVGPEPQDDAGHPCGDRDQEKYIEINKKISQKRNEQIEKFFK